MTKKELKKASKKYPDYRVQEIYQDMMDFLDGMSYNDFMGYLEMLLNFGHIKFLDYNKILYADIYLKHYYEN